jgi:GrpB-like predicted nucleotidyltransferase (UPF0157 family)
MPLGLNKEIVELVRFSSKWKYEYQKEAQILKNMLYDYDCIIEHIGSTSIPNMIAKPIIDILIGVKSFDIIEKVKNTLVEHEYILSPISLGEDELLLGKGIKGGTSYRTHYIHIVVYDSYKWQYYVLFRDYLINNPEIAQEYMMLKKSLSQEFPSNRIEYTRNKEKFIKIIRERAFKEKELLLSKVSCFDKNIINT